LGVLTTAGKAVERWRRRLRNSGLALGNLPEPSRIESLEAQGKALLNGPTPPRGSSRWKIVVWGEEGARDQVLDLDPSVPARDQARRWLEQASKMRRTLVRSRDRRMELERETEEAEAWAREIAAFVPRIASGRAARRECLERLRALRARLLPRGLWPQPPRRKEQPRDDQPVRFELEGGWIVMAGRSGRENDFLTGKVARSDDLWFHAAHVPGAHVILRSPTGKAIEPPVEILHRAAGLAAWLSKLRAQERAEVHYTRRKNVRKPRKSPPGLVLMEQSNSILVRPAPPPRPEGRTT
jgi:hypothetical protein